MVKPDSRKRRSHSGKGAKRTIRLVPVAYYFAAVVIALPFLFPMVWSLLRSLQGVAADGVPPTWHTLIDLTISNYTGLLKSGGNSLFHYAGNSAIAALGTVALSSFVSVLAGYALARLPFWGSNAVFVFLLAPFMVPFQAMITPVFTIMSWLHLTNSLVGLILIYSVFQIPFSVYVMRNSFSAIPGEFEEAAIIDGASTYRVLRHVMLPLALPGIATIALYAFLLGWNEFLGALMLLSSDSLFTLPVALNNLETGLYGQVNMGRLDAGAVIAMVPCLVVFLTMQRYYVRGLAAGGLKA